PAALQNRACGSARSERIHRQESARVGRDLCEDREHQAARTVHREDDQRSGVLLCTRTGERDEDLWLHAQGRRAEEHAGGLAGSVLSRGARAEGELSSKHRGPASAMHRQEALHRVRDTRLVSRTQRSTKWCAAEPGPRFLVFRATHFLMSTPTLPYIPSRRSVSVTQPAPADHSAPPIRRLVTWAPKRSWR